MLRVGEIYIGLAFHPGGELTVRLDATEARVERLV